MSARNRRSRDMSRITDGPTGSRLSSGKPPKPVSSTAPKPSRSSGPAFIDLTADDDDDEDSKAAVKGVVGKRKNGDGCIDLTDTPSPPPEASSTTVGKKPAPRPLTPTAQKKTTVVRLDGDERPAPDNASSASGIPKSPIGNLSTARRSVANERSPPRFDSPAILSSRKQNLAESSPLSTPSENSSKFNHEVHSSGFKAKPSPSSHENIVGETLLANPQSPLRNMLNSTPPISDSDSDDEDDDSSRHGLTPGTPSRRNNRGYVEPAASIGANSPLLEHPQKRKLKSPTQSPRPNPEDIEDMLLEFRQRMKHDHAETVRWLLPDAKAAIVKRAASQPQFTDNGDPFALLTPACLQSGQRSTGIHVQKINSVAHYKSSKLTKAQTTVIAKTIPASNIPKVPRYNAHTNVDRNILCPDDGQLKYIPLLGLDDKGDVSQRKHQQLVTELQEQYIAKFKTGLSTLQTEQAAEIRPYIDSWLDELKLGFDQRALKQRILTYDIGRNELRMSVAERTVLLKAFREPLSDEVEEAADYFFEIFSKVFSPEILEEVFFPYDRIKELVGTVRAQCQKTPKKQSLSESTHLGTHAALICLICGQAECQTHGEYYRAILEASDDSDEYSDDNSEKKKDPSYDYAHRLVVLQPEDMLRRDKIRNSRADNEQVHGRIKGNAPCSAACYKNNLQTDYPILHIDDLSDMLLSQTDKRHRSCHIAFGLNKPCAQVYKSIQDYEEKNADSIRFQLEASPVAVGRTKRPEWYDNKRKVLKGDWMDLTSAHLHQVRTQMFPCAHEGPCSVDNNYGSNAKSKCSCSSNNVLCESFCCCPDDCPRKFTGCGCPSAGLACNSSACICIQMNRECGPECGTCGAVPRINPENKYRDELFTTGCQNISLQRGVSKKMMMGESQLDNVGFGLYLGEPAKKGEYLGEYTGEVISSAEAERRGIVYDRKNLSFLFDLNADWVIDADRRGNKTRFINHADSASHGLNCRAKIVLVNGEHRIKFISLRDIEIGEELLFDYGAKFAEKQGLNKTLPSAESGKKGVLVGQDALDALDGMSQRKKEARGEMTAIRGGHRGGGGGGGRGNNKARKVATSKKAAAVVVESAPDFVEDDDEDDEFSIPLEEDHGDEDEEIVSGPKRRQVRRPARYTR